MSDSRKSLLRFIEEARSERDGLQRDVYRVLDEREVLIHETATLRNRITQLENDMSKRQPIAAPGLSNTVSVDLIITDELCASIMCTALESGSQGIGYWCRATEVKRSPKDANGDWAYLSFHAEDAEREDAFTPGTVDYTVIRAGIARLFSPTTKVRGDIREAVLRDIMSQPEIEGNMDSECADVVVQLGFLNDIVFG